MKQVTLTINVPAEQLKALAMAELGLVPASTRAEPAAGAVLGVACAKRPDAVRMAIEHVIRATEKYDRDQYSHGEASAATALFEAGKRLRAAVAAEKKSISEKGKFHV